MGSYNEDDYAGDGPRLGPASYVIDMEREREREFLEALRFVLVYFSRT